MKIFNWMHRKPREAKGYVAMVARSKVAIACGEDEDRLAGAGSRSNHEEDKQALLLEHVGLVETLNGWRDGILAIGTFGFDEIVVEEDDADVAQPTRGHDEAKTREFLKAAAGFEGKKDEPIDVLGSKPPVGLGLADDYETQKLSLLQHPQEESIMEVDEKREGTEERTRTTLADLFSRPDVHDDSAAEYGGKNDGGAEDGRQKPAYCVKPGEVAAKVAAVAGCKEEEPGTSAKIQKLMAKMMKRKIHPEAQNDTTVKGAGRVKKIYESATVYRESDGSSNHKYAMLGGSSHRSKRSWMNKISMI